MQAARAHAAMLERSLASAAMLSSQRERGAGVFVWTAKDTETFATLADLASDGIMSDVLDEHLGMIASPARQAGRPGCL
jgi:hypothetical protein